MNIRYAILSLGCVCSSGLVMAEQTSWQEFPRSFYVEGLDIEVSQKEMGFEGPYPINGVNITVDRGEETILNETREISGELRGAWVADLDRDRNPEIIVWVRGHGSGGYGEYSLFEIKGKKIHNVQFPTFSESQREGYRGHDQLTTSPSNIIRKFRQYQPNDPSCCPTGAVMEITYGYKKGEIIIERTRELQAQKSTQPTQ